MEGVNQELLAFLVDVQARGASNLQKLSADFKVLGDTASRISKQVAEMQATLDRTAASAAAAGQKVAAGSAKAAEAVNAEAGATDRLSAAQKGQADSSKLSTDASAKQAAVQKDLTAQTVASDASMVRQQRTIKDITGAIKDHTGGLTALGTRLDQSGRKMTAFASTMAPVSLGLLGIGAYSVKMGVDFQRNMYLLQTQAGASAEQVKKLEAGILAMGGKVMQTPQELATGMYHVVSAMNAALKPSERVSGELKIQEQAAKGAAVGHSNLEQTTYALVSAMKALHEPTQHAGNVMATLNAIVGAGDMRMEGLLGALSTGIIPAAKTFGISIQSVGAALDTMTQEGTPPTHAATRLRMALSLLAAPTAQSAKLLGALGLSSKEVTARTQTMSEMLQKAGLRTSTLAADLKKPDGIVVALEDLKKHMEAAGLTSEEQGAMISRAFGGGRMGTSIQMLYRQLVTTQMNYANQLHITGQQGANYKKTTEETAFKWGELRSEIDKAGIELGSELMPVANTILKDVEAMVTWFTKLPAPIKDATLAAVALGAVVSPIAFTMGKLMRVGGGLATVGGKVQGMFGTTAEGAAASAGPLAVAEKAAGGMIFGVRNTPIEAGSMMNPIGVMLVGSGMGTGSGLTTATSDVQKAQSAEAVAASEARAGSGVAGAGALTAAEGALPAAAGVASEAAPVAAEGAAGIGAIAAPEIVLPAMAAAGAGYLAITQIPGLKDEILAALDDIEKAFGPLKPDAEALGKSMTGVFDALGHAFHGVEPEIRDTDKVLGELEKAAAPLFGALITGFDDVAIKSGFLEKTFKTAFSGIADEMRSVLETVTGMLDIVSGLLEGKWGNVWEGAKKIVEGTLTGMLGAVKLADAPFVAAWESFGEKGVDAIGAFGSQMFGEGENLGSELIKGLVKDLEAGVSDVAKAAKTVADIPGEILESVLELGSPSRRMEHIGRQVVQGFVIGVEKGELSGPITTVFTNALGDVQAAVSKGFGGINRELLAELQAMNGGKVLSLAEGGPPLAPGLEKALTRHAHGGRVPGAVGPDNWTLVDPSGRPAAMVGGGELLIANRHTEAEASAATMALYGKTLGQMVAGETRPHSAATGLRVRGPVSTFGPPGEAASGTAYGLSSSDPGIAVNPHGGSNWNDALARSLAMKVAHVVIAGHSANLRVIDKGPSAIGAHGPRLIDVTGAGVRALGIPYGSFPTDAIGEAIFGAGGTPVGGAAFGPIKAPRWTGPGGVLGEIGRTMLSKVAEAATARLAALAPSGGGGAVTAAGSAPTGGGFSPSQLGTFDGLQVAKWIIPELLYARAHGWTGPITSGYRAGFDPKAPGGSMHALDIYPGGAVDFGGEHEAFARANRAAFIKATAGYSGERLLTPIGFTDDGHMSGTGHARGGRVAYAGSFAQGGMVTAHGPTLAMFGEGGRAETALFLPHYQTGGALASIEEAERLFEAEPHKGKTKAGEKITEGLNPDNNQIEWHTSAEWKAIRNRHAQRTHAHAQYLKSHPASQHEEAVRLGGMTLAHITERSRTALHGVNLAGDVSKLSAELWKKVVSGVEKVLKAPSTEVGFDYAATQKLTKQAAKSHGPRMHELAAKAIEETGKRITAQVKQSPESHGLSVQAMTHLEVLVADARRNGSKALIGGLVKDIETVATNWRQSIVKKFTQASGVTTRHRELSRAREQLAKIQKEGVGAVISENADESGYIHEEIANREGEMEGFKGERGALEKRMQQARAPHYKNVTRTVGRGRHRHKVTSRILEPVDEAVVQAIQREIDAVNRGLQEGAIDVASLQVELAKAVYEGFKKHIEEVNATFQNRVGASESGYTIAEGEREMHGLSTSDIEETAKKYQEGKLSATQIAQVQANFAEQKASEEAQRKIEEEQRAYDRSQLGGLSGSDREAMESSINGLTEKIVKLGDTIYEQEKATKELTGATQANTKAQYGGSVGFTFQGQGYIVGGGNTGQSSVSAPDISVGL